jgi:hypothetical protein
MAKLTSSDLYQLVLFADSPLASKSFEENGRGAQI